MQYFLLFTLVSCLTACNYSSIKVKQYSSLNSIPAELSAIIAKEEQSCSAFYNSNNIWIIEQHCSNTEKQGIFIIDSNGTTKFEWFDEPFNSWAWNEGCNSKEDCYYMADVNGHGQVIGITYKLYINLSEGFYNIIIKNSNLIVIDKSIFDHPS